MNEYFFTLSASDSPEKKYPLNTAYSLLNNLTFNHITSKGKCGGKAVCGCCRIQITSGQDKCNPPLAEEKVYFTQIELDQGWRLACQTYCLRNIAFNLPD
ncbi:MAG: 2Fe-2S iron-sulfur cluster binding domain-containing protein [gamma proteobacterium symbiont of Taylorina sp.]|nr:2Fe-2S iron-sulfur cluster binding domain-containing protein [gamma proteobacterium symbiont of Taylorina sp.]